jgi:hypothetical protein
VEGFSSMASASKVWDGLSVEQRKGLLKLVWDSAELMDFESKLDWHKLMPSTQNKLIVALAAYKGD